MSTLQDDLRLESRISKQSVSPSRLGSKRNTRPFRGTSSTDGKKSRTLANAHPSPTTPSSVPFIWQVDAKQILEDHGVFIHSVFQPKLHDEPLGIAPFLLQHICGNRRYVPETVVSCFQNTYLTRVGSYFEGFFRAAKTVARGSVEFTLINPTELEELLIFPEIPFTGLGMSKKGTRGRGISPQQSEKILSLLGYLIALLKHSNNSNEMRSIHICFTVIPVGIGADGISDMMTNLILPDLLSYTERAARAVINIFPHAASHCQELSLIELLNFEYPMDEVSRIAHKFSPADRNSKYLLPLQLNGIPQLFVPQCILNKMPKAVNPEMLEWIQHTNTILRMRTAPTFLPTKREVPWALPDDHVQNYRTIISHSRRLVKYAFVVPYFSDYEGLLAVIKTWERQEKISDVLQLGGNRLVYFTFGGIPCSLLALQTDHLTISRETRNLKRNYSSNDNPQSRLRPRSSRHNVDNSSQSETSTPTPRDDFDHIVQVADLPSEPASFLQKFANLVQKLSPTAPSLPPSLDRDQAQQLATDNNQIFTFYSLEELEMVDPSSDLEKWIHLADNLAENSEIGLLIQLQTDIWISLFVPSDRQQPVQLFESLDPTILQRLASIFPILRSETTLHFELKTQMTNIDFASHDKDTKLIVLSVASETDLVSVTLNRSTSSSSQAIRVYQPARCVIFDKQSQLQLFKLPTLGEPTSEWSHLSGISNVLFVPTSDKEILLSLDSIEDKDLSQITSSRPCAILYEEQSILAQCLLRRNNRKVFKKNPVLVIASLPRSQQTRAIPRMRGLIAAFCAGISSVIASDRNTASTRVDPIDQISAPVSISVLPPCSVDHQRGGPSYDQLHQWQNEFPVEVTALSEIACSILNIDHVSPASVESFLQFCRFVKAKKPDVLVNELTRQFSLRHEPVCIDLSNAMLSYLRSKT